MFAMVAPQRQLSFLGCYIATDSRMRLPMECGTIASLGDARTQGVKSWLDFHQKSTPCCLRKVPHVGSLKGDERYHLPQRLHQCMCCMQ